MAVARHPWHLKAWLKASGKLQADLERDLGMNKAKVSLLATGKQPYNQDDISEIADYLAVKPFELLMHPTDAFAIRNLRASASRIAAGEYSEGVAPDDDFAELKVTPAPRRLPARRTGTHG